MYNLTIPTNADKSKIVLQELVVTQRALIKALYKQLDSIEEENNVLKATNMVLQSKINKLKNLVLDLDNKQIPNYTTNNLLIYITK